MDDGVTLSCRSRSAAGGGGTDSVTIRVYYLPAEVTILGSPTVAENGTLSLACSSAPSNPPVRLRWWLGGRELPHGDTAVTPAEGGGSVSMSNVTLIGHRRDHGRALLCEALSPGLGSRSASVLLGVTHPPQEVWLEGPPPNATFRVGARVRLLCHARGGHPAPRLVWTRDGRPVKDGAPQSGGAVVSRELQIVVTPNDNGAVYRCEVGGQRGGPSAHTRLSVL
ncbi:nephrin isoform X2, partial [Gallus gallus]|uniref:nephrin isoform X2 n=1 Tax=Gallus gallus TaxID=9031 RepID=UPI001AE185F2